MNAHDPDENPRLDEIESTAAVAAAFWLSEGCERSDDIDDPMRAAAALLGFMNAASTAYQAERMIDAADRIRDGLLAVADALPSVRDAMMIERMAGIESELHRIANAATAQELAGVFSLPKGRGDGRK